MYQRDDGIVEFDPAILLALARMEAPTALATVEPTSLPAGPPTGGGGLERLILDVWRQVLGTSPIGRQTEMCEGT